MNIDVKPRISWSEKAEEMLTGCAMCRLFRGVIPYIRIRNFATAEECENLVQSAVKEGFSSYRGVEPVINRIGNTVFEYNSISKPQYFEKNKNLTKVQNRIFANSFNPLNRFVSLLRKRTGKSVGIAENEFGQRYYAGLTRRIEKGTLLHVDYAPGEQPDWSVASVKEQLVWNLYLRVSDAQSGRTHIFNRQWEPRHDNMKEGIYGYNKDVVDGASQATFEPAVGDIVIFNTRNFHYVEPTHGERVAFTSAIGRTPDDEVVLWS
ncbi:MAG: hypothetical protein AAFQ66_08425 [Pseudomonadota bacterium]